jgi:hypothetical protein
VRGNPAVTIREFAAREGAVKRLARQRKQQ